MSRNTSSEKQQPQPESPAPRYLLPRSPDPAVVFVARKGCRETYTLAGRLVDRSKLKHPDKDLEQFEEIDEARANALVLAHLRPAAVAESDWFRAGAGVAPQDELAESVLRFRPRYWRLVTLEALHLIGTLMGMVIVISAVLLATGHFSPASALPKDHSELTLHLMWSLTIGTAIVAGVFLRSWEKRNDLQVHVGDTWVGAPSSRWWSALAWRTGKQRRMEFDDLDRVRSAQRRRIDRILGRQYLYSRHGERVCIVLRAFNKADRAKLLEVLGLDQAGQRLCTCGR